jgi:hypothetical protein
MECQMWSKKDTIIHLERMDTAIAFQIDLKKGQETD